MKLRQLTLTAARTRAGGLLAIIVLMAGSLSSCHLWPTHLERLEKSISEQVPGEASAWLVGGDVVVVNVANSSLFFSPAEELKSVASAIAIQAAAFPEVEVTSVAVTFYEKEISEASEEMREFIFVMHEGQLTLVDDPGI